MSRNGSETLKDRLGMRLGRWWQKLTRKAEGDDQWLEPESSTPGTLLCVEDAHREWLAAKAYFESVEHPDLVDHAVHVLLAAEKRYEFLLREAKSEGVVASELMDTVNYASQGSA